MSEENIAVYGKDFADRIVEDVQNEWNKLTSLVMSRIEELLTNFNKECYMSIPEGFISINKEGVEDPSVKDIQMRDRIGKMRNEMFLGSAITSALGKHTITSPTIRGCSSRV